MTDPTELKTDDPKPVAVQFLSTPLSNGREIWVGYNKDDTNDHGYFFRFVNGEAVTKLRLSDEAFAAIIRLKADVDIYRDTGEICRWIATIDPDGKVTVAEAT